MTIPSSLVHLQALGTGRVTRTEGDSTAPLLTQPRRLAVLAYLVLARPRGLQSRDTIVSLFWPETDQASARHALRNALHGIRQALGEVIVIAGDEQVGVDRERVSCDAIDLEADLAAGRYAVGVARYHGELLQGFHVADAPDFERWLDAERSRLHDLVFRASVAHAESCRQRGEMEESLLAARRASAMAPEDEASLRRLMQILSLTGDRAGALREYDKFVARADDDDGVQPGPDTLQLARALRAPSEPSLRPTESPAAADLARTLEVSSHESVAGPTVMPQSVAALRGARYIGKGRKRVLAGGVAVVAAIMLTIIGWRARASEARSTVAPTSAEAIDRGSRLPERYRADTALLRRYLAAEASREGLRLKAARQSFQELANETPLYAPAWAGLSFTLFQSGFNDMPPADALPRAVAAANRALALDSTLVEAQSTLIANAMFGRWDLVDAKKRLDTALARNPNDPELKNLLATWYRWRGEHDAAIRLKRDALATDPLSPRYANQAVSSLYFGHRCGEAAELSRRIAEERRDQSYIRLYLYRSLKCLGKMDEAAIALHESLIETGDTALAGLLAPPLPASRRDAAINAVFRARLDQYFVDRQNKWKSSTVAMVQYAELGNRDSTLVWLDSMYVERAMMLHVVPFDPLMDFLRDDPRFQAFLRRLPWAPRTAMRLPSQNPTEALLATRRNSP